MWISSLHLDWVGAEILILVGEAEGGSTRVGVLYNINIQTNRIIL